VRRFCFVLRSSVGLVALCLLIIPPHILLIPQVSSTCAGWAAATTCTATGCVPEATARPPIRYNYRHNRSTSLVLLMYVTPSSSTNRSEFMPQMRMLIITGESVVCTPGARGREQGGSRLCVAEKHVVDAARGCAAGHGAGKIRVLLRVVPSCRAVSWSAYTVSAAPSSFEARCVFQ
jgi:hypothetical protein